MRKILILLLAVSMVLGMLAGCKKTDAPDSAETAPVVTTQETEPAPTVPEDGNPGDVTCKGSYTGVVDEAKVVATVGDAKLTSGMLQVFYWAEVAAYRQAGHETAPDFSAPLDTQICPVDGSVGSWQQYFLKRALNAWHTAQALVFQGADEGVPTEEAYKPDPEKHAEYMTDMPADKVLYGFYDEYVPNSMHQAYLDNIPEMLDQLAQEKGFADAAAMAGEAFGVSVENLKAYTELYNRGYMYFTTLGYDLAPEEGEEVTGGEKLVDFRQMLLIPAYPENPWHAPDEIAEVGPDGVVSCSETLWAVGEEEAQKMLNKWKQDRFTGEATFADMANKNSVDMGSQRNGGLYRRIRQGQLLPEVEAWCFDPARQAGDTGIVRSPYGLHVLYFAGGTDAAAAEAQDAQLRGMQETILSGAREKYPAEIRYSDIVLGQAQPEVGAGDLLYPDVAHERFPEVPLYLQQDYPDTQYGAFPIRTHGCGITTWSMLASYMTDDEMTPPEMCERYANYCHPNGTDGMMFNREPAVNGFYLQYKTYNAAEAKAALEEGYIVVCAQTKGYWTRGGHYLLLENIDEEDMVQVRDSNIFNYGRLPNHKNDKFEWKVIPPKGVGYWIYDNKITRIPACTRCGSLEGLIADVIPSDYVCEKCSPAMLRRDTYLGG